MAENSPVMMPNTMIPQPHIHNDDMGERQSKIYQKVDRMNHETLFEAMKHFSEPDSFDGKTLP